MMAWTEITRAKYRRDELRYASDTTDAEWSVIAAHLPAPSTRGRPRTTDLREVFNAIFYLAQSGCQWRLLPKDFPAFTTVQGYFYRWRDDGTWQTINHHLLMQARGGPGSQPDSWGNRQPVGQEAGGPRGYDAGKKIKGRKRHLLTDTTGLPVAVIVHEADIQDRDGGPALLDSIRSLSPWLRHIFADGAYAGNKFAAALAPLGDWTVEIIKRSDTAKGFVLLPRRWVVERTIAWLNRNLAKDFEALISTSTTWVMIASVKLIMRRLARG
jgi:transposase